MWKTWTELTSPDGRRSCASVWRLLGSQGFSGIYMFPRLDPSHCQRATHMTWGEVTELGDSRADEFSLAPKHVHTKYE